ncbi:MAG: hypothetical protein HDR94_01785 [Bacteroides sp.]|nr:hypothetical protein [Bacteroides sp.]
MNQHSMSEAYMWAFIIMVIFFVVAVIVANLIPYKPKNPGTTPRRICFWTLGVATGVVAFVVNSIIAQGILVPNIKSDFLMHSAIASALFVIIYILLGFSVSKIFSSSKVGTWF